MVQCGIIDDGFINCHLGRFSVNRRQSRRLARKQLIPGKVKRETKSRRDEKEVNERVKKEWNRYFIKFN